MQPCPDSKSPEAFPHKDGSGELESTFEIKGDVRGKNQILIEFDVHSVANTPPPFSLKGLPKEPYKGSSIPQPALSLPKQSPAPVTHPAEVCNVM